MSKKTVKFKLSKLYQLQNELSLLLNEKISFTTKWEIRNIINSFKDSQENFQKTREEIYKKFGEEDKEKGGYNIAQEKIEEANKELKDLGNKEVSVTGKIALKELETIESENPYFLVFGIVEK